MITRTVVRSYTLPVCFHWLLSLLFRPKTPTYDPYTDQTKGAAHEIGMTAKQQQRNSNKLEAN